MARASDDKQKRIIGRNIERLLFEHEMTQAELAEKLNLSDSSVTNWVTGRNAPSMGNVQRMAEYFRVPKSAILEEQASSVPVLSRERAFLFDRIANASSDDLRKLSELLDFIEKQTRNQ